MNALLWHSPRDNCVSASATISASGSPSPAIVSTVRPFWQRSWESTCRWCALVKKPCYIYYCDAHTHIHTPYVGALAVDSRIWVTLT